jgi:hypothetical protein
MSRSSFPLTSSLRKRGFVLSPQAATRGTLCSEYAVPP